MTVVFDPVAAYRFVARDRACPGLHVDHDHAGCLAHVEFSRVVGLNPSQFGKWMKQGSIGPLAADRLAARIGVHPITIWPDEWEQYLGLTGPDEQEAA